MGSGSLSFKVSLKFPLFPLQPLKKKKTNSNESTAVTDPSLVIINAFGIRDYEKKNQNYINPFPGNSGHHSEGSGVAAGTAHFG